MVGQPWAAAQAPAFFAILLMALSLGGDIPGSLLKGVAESVFWLPVLATLLLAAAIFSRKGRRPR